MKRNPAQTGAAAAYAAAAQLAARHYDVALTVGNTKAVDLLCAVPHGAAFKVQVKGIARQGPVFIRKEAMTGPVDENLYFVIVIVPLCEEPGPMRFFVMTHRDVVETAGRQREVRVDGKPYKDGADGFAFREFRSFEGNWAALPPIGA